MKLMLKLKISAIAVFLVLAIVAMNNSSSFSSSAKGDVLEEIANYKTWTVVTKEPIVVESDNSALVGS